MMLVRCELNFRFRHCLKLLCVDTTVPRTKNKLKVFLDEEATEVSDADSLSKTTMLEP